MKVNIVNSTSFRASANPKITDKKVKSKKETKQKEDKVTLQKYYEEEIQKLQNWKALINKPQTFSKEK